MDYPQNGTAVLKRSNHLHNKHRLPSEDDEDDDEDDDDDDDDI